MRELQLTVGLGRCGLEYLVAILIDLFALPVSTAEGQGGYDALGFLKASTC